MKTITILFITLLVSTSTLAANQEIQSFNKAKKILEKQVYNNHRKTLYCSATFDAQKKVKPPKGFTPTKYVNALRSNYNFTMLPSVKSDFGSCTMKIDNRKAEPPEAARGQIARTYLYMEGAYKRYNMSKSQRQLMNAWDKMYPVNAWECARAKKITGIQQNDNHIVKSRCKSSGVW